MFQSIISVLWGQLSIIKEKDQVKSSKKILMITRTKAFCWLLMWLITVSAFNKRSFWLPVFLVLFWLVCRCCTKREKKTQTKQKGKKKPKPTQAKYMTPQAPLHTLAGPYFSLSLLTKRIQLIAFCAKVHRVFNYSGIDWLNFEVLWILHFFLLVFRGQIKEVKYKLIQHFSAAPRRVLLGRWDLVRWDGLHTNPVFRIMSNL